MESSVSDQKIPSGTEQCSDVPPVRLLDFIWRPFRAKAVWTGSAIYWSGCVASFWVPGLSALYQSALSFCLYIFFCPPITVAILGVSFVRAKLDKGDWVVTEAPQNVRFPDLSVGGLPNPSTDPLDPRSGDTHWRHQQLNG